MKLKNYFFKDVAQNEVKVKNFNFNFFFGRERVTIELLSLHTRN